MQGIHPARTKFYVTGINTRWEQKMKTLNPMTGRVDVEVRHRHFEFKGVINLGRPTKVKHLEFFIHKYERETYPAARLYFDAMMFECIAAPLYLDVSHK
jgi:hypothetical protein